MTDKYPSVTCPKCDVVVGVVKQGKLLRGSNYAWDNYCPYCSKDLTKTIGDIIYFLKIKNK